MTVSRVSLGLLVGALILGSPAVARAQSDSSKSGSAGGNGGAGVQMQMGGNGMQMGNAAGQQKLTISDTALKKLVGTWKGGTSDNDTSITMVVRADTGFTWTGKGVPPCMTKPGKIKRITDTNISWCGGPGHNYTLNGKTLELKPVQGGRFVFTQVSTEAKKP